MSVFPAMCAKSGLCVAFPDVCLTPAPPAPVPYPNLAQAADGKGTGKVKITNSDALCQGHRIRCSNGDAAGTAGGGTISHTILGPANIKSGTSKVRAAGKPLAHQTSNVAQNGANANAPGGIHVAPCQTKVLVFAPLPGRKRNPPTKRRERGKDPVADAQELLDCSPTLRRQIEELRSKGWTIRYSRGEEPEGSWMIRKRKTIVLDSGFWHTPSLIAVDLAHEVGHALFRYPSIPNTIQNCLTRPHACWSPSSAPSPMPYREFRRRAMFWRDGRDEGAAVINAFRVQKEIEQECPGRDLSGFHHGRNHQHYRDCADRADSDEIRAQLDIARRYQMETPSDDKYPTYLHEWIESFEQNLSPTLDRLSRQRRISGYVPTGGG